MNISIFVICYNEEIILQKFINHYRTRFPNCEITIYDNMSTDNSRQIAIKNGCKVLEYDSNNEIRDDLYLEIKGPDLARPNDSKAKSRPFICFAESVKRFS